MDFVCLLYTCWNTVWIQKQHISDELPADAAELRPQFSLFLYPSFICSEFIFKVCHSGRIFTLQSCSLLRTACAGWRIYTDRIWACFKYFSSQKWNQSGAAEVTGGMFIIQGQRWLHFTAHIYCRSNLIRKETDQRRGPIYRLSGFTLQECLLLLKREQENHDTPGQELLLNSYSVSCSVSGSAGAIRTPSDTRLIRRRTTGRGINVRNSTSHLHWVTTAAYFLLLN